MSSKRSNKVAPSPSESEVPAVESHRRAHEKFGWTALLVALTFGVVLEGYLGFRSPLIEDELRHDLWSLAHFHAAMLAILNLVYGRWAEEQPFALASSALMIGSGAIPLGFFLGGLSHPEGDPGAWILLVPVGAVLVLAAVAHRAISAWRR